MVVAIRVVGPAWYKAALAEWARRRKSLPLDPDIDALLTKLVVTGEQPHLIALLEITKADRTRSALLFLTVRQIFRGGGSGWFATRLRRRSCYCAACCATAGGT